LRRFAGAVNSLDNEKLAGETMLAITLHEGTPRRSGAAFRKP
jgi:hypothetical protein